MPILTVCDRHRRLVPAGQACPECAASRAAREHVRRSANNVRLGRNTPQWRRLSARAIRQARGVCPSCGVIQSKDDPGSKLTCDLIGGGDHRGATDADVRVLCRRCHARV